MRPGFWRHCRVCFRWCRISILLLILAAACVLLWFNQVGLPAFLKEPLLRNLEAKGVLVEFTRMRLRMTRGIVVENVRMGVRAGVAGDSQNPTLTIGEAQLLLDFGQLVRGHLQIQGLVLRQGWLVVPINEASQPLETLELTNIQTDLRFKENETWALDNFQAGFKNTELALSGDLAHAPEIRKWEIFNRPKGGPKGGQNWPAKLRNFSEILERIHLDGTPRLSLNIEGDARDPHSFDVRLQVTAPSARTPWFGARNLEFAANLTAPASMATNTTLPGVWGVVQPYQLVWSTHFDQLRSEKLNADSVAANGFWRAPELAVTDLSVRLGQGRLAASLQYDAASQRVSFTNSSAFDLPAIERLLPETARQWLASCYWSEPPALWFGGTADLSAWPHPSAVIVQGGLAMAQTTLGMVAVDQMQTHFSYSNGVWQVPELRVVRDETRLQLDATGDQATKIFNLHVQGTFDVNMIRPWLKSKTAVREVGRLAFRQPLHLNVTVRGRMDDAATLAAEGQLALTNFSARGGPMDSLVTDVSYTNRVLVFSHPQAWRKQGTQAMSADAVILDLNAYRLWFKNGFSTAEPQFVANSIGPKTGRTLEPYQFLEPPTARVNGYVSLRSSEDSQEMTEEDLRVDILKGAPFRWLRFNSRRGEGTIRWLGGTLDLTNMNLEFYQGRAVGNAHFDFRPRFGTDFSFAWNVTNANLHWLMVDLASPSNHLEGMLGGRVVVTSGNSTNWQLMSGYGNASLHDGLIWDARLFGVLSPALNTIAPGLGSSRATDAAAAFNMTNGVIYSDSLEIRTTMMQLHYDGTVDLHENINARATAQPLRDTGLGHLIRIISWPVTELFEYKVTGTLENPHMAPYHDISKLLLAPLHPIKTLEGILPVGNTNSPTISTNAPARR